MSIKNERFMRKVKNMKRVRNGEIVFQVNMSLH